MGTNSKGAKLYSLDAYRRTKSTLKKPCLFHLKNENEKETQVSNLNQYQLEEIRSYSSLWTKSCAFNPELILIDASLDWADPLELIHELKTQIKVPVILMTDGVDSRPSFIKDAYSVGIDDVLYTPLCLDELSQAMRVLLRIPLEQKQRH